MNFFLMHNVQLLATRQKMDWKKVKRRGWERDEDAAKFTNPFVLHIRLATLGKKWFIVFVSWSVCVSSPPALSLFIVDCLSCPLFALMKCLIPPKIFPKTGRIGWRQRQECGETFSFLCNYEKQQLKHHRKGREKYTKARKFSQPQKNRLIFEKLCH